MSDPGQIEPEGDETAPAREQSRLRTYTSSSKAQRWIVAYGLLYTAAGVVLAMLTRFNVNNGDRAHGIVGLAQVESFRLFKVPLTGGR